MDQRGFYGGFSMSARASSTARRVHVLGGTCSAPVSPRWALVPRVGNQGWVGVVVRSCRCRLYRLRPPRRQRRRRHNEPHFAWYRHSRRSLAAPRDRRSRQARLGPCRSFRQKSALPVNSTRTEWWSFLRALAGIRAPTALNLLTSGFQERAGLRPSRYERSRRESHDGVTATTCVAAAGATRGLS